MQNLICEPIGIIRTDKKVKFDAPRQPAHDTIERNIVELFPGKNFEQGIRDLDGFDRIWLIWWFDRNQSWRPMVLPPRGTARRRGVFATRSPHRPCPIGITSVPLLKVSGLQLIVGNCDLLDRTPILDIKPYISGVDSFPNQRQGWLDENEDDYIKPSRFRVELTTLAKNQSDWLAEHWQIDFMSKVVALLQRDPSPHRIRRITKAKNGIFRLSSGGWRVFFSVVDLVVTVHSITPGYPHWLLVKEGFEVIPDYQAQLAFVGVWPT